MLGRHGRRVVVAVGLAVLVLVAAGLVTAPARAAGTTGCSVSGAVLRVGSRGADVACLQQQLAARGIDPGPVDGIFGPVTRRAVVAYQRAERLYVDGVVGPQTGGRLGIWPGSTRPACDLALAREAAARRPDAGQLVVVRATAPGSALARVDLVDVAGGTLTPVACDLDARVGRSGVRAPRVDGDGSTPGGVFDLGTMTAPDGQVFSMFGTAADPGVRAPYRQVADGDCWSMQPYTAAYNQLVAADEARCRNELGNDSEYLPAFVGSYRHAAVIGYNLGPHRSGDEPGEVLRGGAIFLHRHSYDATGRPQPLSGCVSLDLADLLATLRWLDPASTPVFAIGVTGTPLG